MGSPIRKSPDHRMFASPRGLSQLTTSFIACLCLGIPTYALSSLTIKSIHFHRCFQKLSVVGYQLSVMTPDSLLPTTYTSLDCCRILSSRQRLATFVVAHQYSVFKELSSCRLSVISCRLKPTPASLQPTLCFPPNGQMSKPSGAFRQLTTDNRPLTTSFQRAC